MKSLMVYIDYSDEHRYASIEQLSVEQVQREMGPNDRCLQCEFDTGQRRGLEFRIYSADEYSYFKKLTSNPSVLQKIAFKREIEIGVDYAAEESECRSTTP